jgi:GT2 family glycosyltransferase
MPLLSCQACKPPCLIDQESVLGNWFLDDTEPALFLHACSLFRREVFEEIRFDENYRGSYFREETDIYLSARRRGFRTVFSGDCVCFHLGTMAGGNRDYRFRLPGKLSAILHEVPSIVYMVLNNNYFLNKYYDCLRKEFGYKHKKGYYKRLFALRLLKDTLTEYIGDASALVQRTVIH